MESGGAVVPSPVRRGGRRRSVLPILVRQELACLESQLAVCERCYGPERRYPVRFERPANRPRVLVLLERPSRSALGRGGRIGFEQPDAAISFLREMLTVAAIPIESVLLGAVVLCRPSSRSLEAAVPAATCLRECAGHVRELIRLSEPELVLPLGRAALRSLRRVWPDEPGAQGLRFPESVGHPVAIGPHWVHPVYHVTRRARVTRTEPQQREDWAAVGRLWEWVASGAGSVPPKS